MKMKHEKNVYLFIYNTWVCVCVEVSFAPTELNDSKCVYGCLLACCVYGLKPIMTRECPKKSITFIHSFILFYFAILVIHCKWKWTRIIRIDSERMDTRKKKNPKNYLSVK